jgi:hypothetical protein
MSVALDHTALARRERGSRLAWGLLVATLILALATVVLLILNRQMPRPSGLYGPRGFQIPLSTILAFSGWLIARQRQNPIGWFLLASGLLAAVAGAAEQYWIAASAPRMALPGPGQAIWLNGLLMSPIVGLNIYVLLLFPTGRLPSRGWWWVGLLGALGIALVTLSSALTPTGINLGQPEGRAAVFYNGGLLAAAAAAALAGWSLVVRFRRATGKERQQLAWVAYATTIVVLVGVPSSLILELEAPPIILDLAETVFLLTFLLHPASITIAILRYRLYDIDLVINRTLVYGSLTLLLGTVYVGGVVGLPLLVRLPESDLVVAGTTLLVAALFNPLRRRIQAFVNRRFYRSRYNAQLTLEAFGSRLREQVDLETLLSELQAVVRDTLQPSSVGVWVRGEH